jgi:hypothetical protein
MVSEVIIVGGGASIKPYLSELHPLLATKFTILTNYAYKHFLGTFSTFIDRDFYKPRPGSNNPDIYEELKQLPLIVGINDNGIEEFKLNNTILLARNQFYTGNLTGIFSLSLANFLINSNGTIYLLGFDWSRRLDLLEKDKKYNPKSDLQIHYYSKDEINHRGHGYVGYYENHNPDKAFEAFIYEKNLKIYNVSLGSNINCFEKISYVQFFGLMSNKKENQEELRKEIRTKLCIL